MDYTSASDVVNNDDLLRLILLRVRCPSCLVSAALTSKRWLRGASEQVFVPDFCACHSPHLLGLYVSGPSMSSGTEFIPLLQPDAASPVVSAVLNHANFGFGNLPLPNVLDSRNGFVLFQFGQECFNHSLYLAVRSPLRYSDKDTAKILPWSPEPFSFSEYPQPHAMLLHCDHDGTALCYSVNVRTTWESDKIKLTAVVFVMRSGSRDWDIYCIAVGSLAKSPFKILNTTVLVDGKIYMATQAGYILGLDLAKQKFFIVDLPEGVEDDQYPGNLVHYRGDDSVLYLFHVDAEDRLNVWLRRMNGGDDHGHGGTSAAGGGSANNGWVLKDTIPLRETCGHLVEQGWEAAGDGDEYYTPTAMVVGAGDNAEFVLLELGDTGVVVYMHLMTREVKKVYEREPDDDCYITVHPFMLVKPPVFPVL